LKSKSGGRGARKKGFQFERDVVNYFKDLGYKAERMYASSGASRGLPPDVDVVLHVPGSRRVLIQAKRLKKLPKWLTFAGGYEAVIAKQDNIPAVVVLPLNVLADLMRRPGSCS
jgi:Holliday junction resolvase